MQIPRSDFVVAIVFGICTGGLAALYPRIDLNTSYQEILQARNIPFLTFYIPAAIAFWLLQLIAVGLLARRSYAQSERAYRLQLGLSVLMLVITGTVIAWKVQIF